MRQQFDVKKDVPNFAVLDCEGRVRYTTAGKLNQQQFTELTEVIDALRLEAVQATAARAEPLLRR